MKKIVGIDLGTTNSVIGYSENGKVTIIPNKEGKRITPSIVYFGSNGEVLVGELAKRRKILEPHRTIYSVKTLMGKFYEEVKDWIKDLPYKVVPNEDGEAVIEIDGDIYTPQEISAEILKYLINSAEEFLNEKIEYAVITVPAYFDNRQREATIEAGKIAGIEVLRIINEPTAAALSYGIDSKSDEHIAVFDFGGGTFDISILSIKEEIIEVRSTAGNTFLGGNNIDTVIVNWFLEHLKASYPEENFNKPQILSRLYEVAESAKCELSFKENVEVNIPFLANTINGEVINFNMILNRNEFNKKIVDILEDIKIPCLQALKDANLEPKDISTVLLAGGSTRIPIVQEICKNLFQKEPAKILNPDEAIAIGAAIHSEMLIGDLQEILLLDVTPLSLGVEVEGGLFEVLIPRNSSIPTVAKKIFTTTRDNQTAITIHVLQGERKLAKDNRTLARFRLEGIPPAPKEVPKIEVTFAIDVNGVLKVSATELSSGKSNEIEITSYRNVSEDFIERVLKEASEKVEEDKHLEKAAKLKRRCFRLYDEIFKLLKEEKAFIPEKRLLELEKENLKLRSELNTYDFNKICIVQKKLEDLKKEIKSYIEK